MYRSYLAGNRQLKLVVMRIIRSTQIHFVGNMHSKWCTRVYPEYSGLTL
jgi:hypothetical protein